MKTAIIYERFDDDLICFILEGDYSKFNKIYINGVDDKLSTELYNLLYYPDEHEKAGYFKYPVIEEISENWEQIKQCDKLIICGFVP